MTREEVFRDRTVPANLQDTWATMPDVDLLVDWIGVLGEAETIAPLDRHGAQASDRGGMTSMRADPAIEVATLQSSKIRGETDEVLEELLSDLSGALARPVAPGRPAVGAGGQPRWGVCPASAERRRSNDLVPDGRVPVSVPSSGGGSS